MTLSESVLEKDTVGFKSSGPSPTAPPTSAPAARSRAATLHLIGLGKVGRAFLQRLPQTPWALVGASDARATCVAHAGLDPRAIDRHKREQSLAGLAGAEVLPTALAVELVGAQVLVDATPSDPGRAVGDAARTDAALRRGARVAIAAKHALAREAHRWLGVGSDAAVGCNAALGGTGLLFVDQRQQLATSWRSIAAVPNATSTAILQAVEQGCSVAEGIERARALGLLEADPSHDLDGTDAAVKLAIVGGALCGRRLDCDDRPALDLRAVDVDEVRARGKRGATTRVVARVARDGVLRVACEEVALGSPLAVPADRVAYTYDLGQALRLHVGLGLGPIGTAQALVDDVAALLAAPAAGEGAQ